jgi:hypothetical protein
MAMPWHHCWKAPRRYAPYGIEDVARRHNALGVTSEIEPRVRPFYGGPYRELGSGRFVDGCLAQVEDPWLLRCRSSAGSTSLWTRPTCSVNRPRRAVLQVSTT